jgi:hypothetical protein
MHMLTKLALFAGAASVAVVAWPLASDAKSGKRHPLAASKRAKPVYDDNSAWYPNDANQLKLGSRIWWEQMEREGRLGRPGIR